MSAFFWGYMPAQVVGGYLSDKYGGEFILGIAGMVWSLLTLAVPFLPMYPILFVSPTMIIIAARMCTGLSQGLLLKMYLSFGMMWNLKRLQAQIWVNGINFLNTELQRCRLLEGSGAMFPKELF